MVLIQKYKCKKHKLATNILKTNSSFETILIFLLFFGEMKKFSLLIFESIDCSLSSQLLNCFNQYDFCFSYTSVLCYVVIVMRIAYSQNVYTNKKKLKYKNHISIH